VFLERLVADESMVELLMAFQGIVEQGKPVSLLWLRPISVGDDS
jgi:hypothetical protein